MSTLQGKTALITGSGRGLGRHIAMALARDGVQVAINYLQNHKAAEQTARSILEISPTCLTIRADLRDENQVLSLIDQVEQKTGRLDILINTVGEFAQRPLLQTEIDLWRNMLESNLTSAFLASKAAIPVMKKNSWGRIINIGLASASSVRAYEQITPYAIAKTGLLILTHSLARQVAEFGITVNCVSPGHMRDGSQQSDIDEQDLPMRRLGTASDLLAAIRFFSARTQPIQLEAIFSSAGAGVSRLRPGIIENFLQPPAGLSFVPFNSFHHESGSGDIDLEPI